MNEPIYIDLTLEDSSVIHCQVLAEYTVDDSDYIALIPVNEDNEADETADIYIYGAHYEGDEIQLIDLSDEEFDLAGAALEDILAENE